MALPIEVGSMPFIVSTSKEKPNDAETRKLIRSHVMLGKNRGKTRRYKGGIITGSRDGISAREKIKILARSSCAPSFDRLASWQSLIPFADSIGTQLLQDIVEFTSIAKKLLFPLEVCISFDRHDKTWFEPLFFDALYLHTLAFSTHYYFKTLFGRCDHGSGREPEIHFVKTLSLLRTRLQFPDERAISEVTVMVVLSLVIHAAMTNDLTSARSHLEGLHRLLSLRGGFSSVSRPKFLVETFRCDIGLALSTSVGPMFFRDPFWEPLFPYPDEDLFFAQSAGTDCSCPTMGSIQDEVDENLANAWTTMKKFCFRISFAADTGQKLSLKTLLDTMASVMYRLLDMSFETGSWNEAIRLGMLAFTSNVFLHRHSLKLSQHQIPDAYRKCATRLGVDDAHSARFMQWYLIVGAISGFMPVDESWFTVYLQSTRHLPATSSFRELQYDLEFFLWIGHLHNGPGMDIYASISNGSLHRADGVSHSIRETAD